MQFRLNPLQYRVKWARRRRRRGGGLRLRADEAQPGGAADVRRARGLLLRLDRRRLGILGADLRGHRPIPQPAANDRPSQRSAQH